MAFVRTILPVLTILFLFCSFSEARDFLVGGKENSWASPSSADSLIQWAEKTRFRVGDFLVFNYDPNTDSVLQVTKEEYESCSNSNPVKEYKGGKTKVELDRSGPFYFISKAEGKCKKGQRLTVIVLSHGHRAPAHSPLPAPEQAPKSLPSELAPTALAPAPQVGGANGVRCGFIGLLVGVVSLVGMILN
ncbi:early nodulin-like protein 1 [Carya illinoinensis]|uniref:Phytocyanin domain-containing protein n=1 Tax=Carya illinoinensis TaxID=32201 RepID=A0A8T1NCB5_CARIL|nr:early nodulin-like protein 1 [Carya illinoinensis]KAG6627985.1 hypothetical protein CIPAW_15G168000 [Carya illinoinensis]KAG6676445.1 hypothetical protein I3842_15G151600 [Carya illinoinensis]